MIFIKVNDKVVKRFNYAEKAISFYNKLAKEYFDYCKDCHKRQIEFEEKTIELYLNHQNRLIPRSIVNKLCISLDYYYWFYCEKQ